MRYFFLILFAAVTLLSSLLHASQKVEFTANRIHALLVFVETISGTSNRPQQIKKVFDESKFNNDESKKHIENFKQLDAAFGNFFEYEGLPKERKNGVGVRTLVTTQSAFSRDLNDFRQRILGLMKYDELSQLIGVLSYFEPIYESLIWSPNLKALNKATQEFKNKSKSWKLDEMFGKVTAFYSSSWPKDQVFRISLYPVPKEAKNSNGQSFGAFESIGFIIGEDIEQKFGVVFHELCHSVYDAQSAEFQKKLSSWFLKSSSQFSLPAYGLFNEAMATALGNGWAYEKAKGKSDEGEWYNDDKINGLAKAVYPKVVEYLNLNKAIDEEFVNHTINKFAEEFPNSLSEFGTFFSAGLVMLSDGTVSSSGDLRRELRRHFRVQSIYSRSSIDHEESKKDILNNELDTVLFFLNEKNLKQLNGLKDVLPKIDDILKKVQRGKTQIGMFSFEKRKVIIVVLQDSSDAIKVIQWMGKERLVETLEKFQKLELK